MKTFEEKMDFVDQGRALRRFHTVQVHHEQRIDSHSYGVAVLALALIQTDDAERRNRVMTAALTHDLAEHMAGDLPAPVKRTLGTEWRNTFNTYEESLLAEHGFASALDAADARVLKMADALDGCLFCINERRMGSTSIVPVFRNFWSYVHGEQKIRSHPEFKELGEQDMYDYVTRKWRSVNLGEW